MEIISAILGAVAGVLFGIIARPFIPALDAWASVIERRYGPTPTANDLFDIEFVNAQGENFYSKNDDPKLKLGDLSWFVVKARFKCHARQALVVTNIDLQYPTLNAWPGQQTITIDGDTLPTDSRYGLQRHISFGQGDVKDVNIRRRFHCKTDLIWDSDHSYEDVLITVEFTTLRSKGFARLNVEGTLTPGGSVSDMTMTLLPTRLEIAE